MALNSFSRIFPLFVWNLVCYCISCVPPQEYGRQTIDQHIMGDNNISLSSLSGNVSLGQNTPVDSGMMAYCEFAFELSKDTFNNELNDIIRENFPNVPIKRKIIISDKFLSGTLSRECLCLSTALRANYSHEEYLFLSEFFNFFAKKLKKDKSLLPRIIDHSLDSSILFTDQEIFYFGKMADKYGLSNQEFSSLFNERNPFHSPYAYNCVIKALANMMQELFFQLAQESLVTLEFGHIRDMDEISIRSNDQYGTPITLPVTRLSVDLENGRLVTINQRSDSVFFLARNSSVFTACASFSDCVVLPDFDAFLIP